MTTALDSSSWRTQRILLDDATVSAAEPRISRDALGERLLRGQRRPVLLTGFVGKALLSHPCREAAPLIGREAEKARIAEI